MRKLGGKNAIVTGANRGLGRAFVTQMADQGCNIWAFVRSESEEFENFCREKEDNAGVFIKPVYVDLSSESSIKGAFKQVSSEKKNIDFLINNAGIGHMGFFQMTKMDYIRKLYEVNLFAPMLLSQLCMRPMSKQKYGKIINVASTAASEIYEGNSIYGSSKAALVAFTQSFAAEAYPYGISVNAIAPGLIATDMSVIFEGKDPEEPIRHTALGRKIETKEIADVVINLLSDEMDILNGTVITLNGGHK